MSLEVSSLSPSLGSNTRVGTRLKWAGTCLAALSWMTLPSVGHAAMCVVKDHGVVQAGPVNVPVSLVGASSLEIDPNAPANTLLGKLSVVTSGMDTDINCTGPGSSTFYMRMQGGGAAIGTVSSGILGGRYPGSATLYQSPIPGIGYAVSWDGAGWAGWMPVQRTGPGWSMGMGSTLTVYLVKTSDPIPEGVNYLNGTFATWTMQPMDERWINFVFGGDVPIIPTNPTCTVTTLDVVVDLNAAEPTDFPSVSSTAKEKDFSVSLACSGGDPGTKTEVNMSLTDQTMPSNVSQNLSLTTASTATGVGLQIVRNGTAISFDPAVNKFKVQDVLPGNSTIDIPFKARYIRTGAMTPGIVQGIATFTMEYK